MIRNLYLALSILSLNPVFAQETQVQLMDVDLYDSNKSIIKGSATRTADLLHLDLNVRFDWKNQHLHGDATWKAKPYFYDLDTLVLDAKGMEIHQVYLAPGKGRNLKYRYDGSQIHIALDKTYHRNETFKVQIIYTAKPNELTREGSSAITDAKGLYFINPTNEAGGYMPQIWTQGEPESNSCWFPVIDKPNERFTHEIGITVDQKYKTLSNGKLSFQTKNGDGTRTDFWTMDQTNAAYLVMLAVGEFASVDDQWRNLKLHYLVEKEHAQDAKYTFGRTPDMLEFFSKKLGVDYPWKQFDQIIVREYVSGAMENTGAVIFGDFCYLDSISKNDKHQDAIVAHEMFHHWFGDYVTAEGWANLPLNESFATYGEYLWFENDRGKDYADWHLLEDLNNYLWEARSGKMENLIRYNYSHPDAMFDNHSYAKGGRILHMLRHELGDDAFFAGLQWYLTKNALQPVEVHQLRQAMEEISGRDLTQFFNEWFLAKGHPVLHVTHKFDKESGEQILTIDQNQDLNEVPLYHLNVEVDIYTSLGKERHLVKIDQQHNEYRFPVVSQPFLVNFDAEHYLLAEIEEEKGDAFLLHQMANGPLMLDRYLSLMALGKTTNKNLLATIVNICLEDKFFGIQLKALSLVSKCDANGLKKVKPTVQKLLTDKNMEVRAEALNVWHKVYNESDVAFYEAQLKVNSYLVQGEALLILDALDGDKTKSIAEKMITRGNYYPVKAAWEVLFGHLNADQPEAFEKWLKLAKVEQRETLVFPLWGVIKKANPQSALKLIEIAKRAAEDCHCVQMHKYGAYTTMNSMALKAENKEISKSEREAYGLVVEELKKFVNGDK